MQPLTSMRSLAAACLIAQCIASEPAEQRNVLFERGRPGRIDPAANRAIFADPKNAIRAVTHEDSLEGEYRDQYLGTFEANGPIFQDINNAEQRFYHAKVADFLRYADPKQYTEEEAEEARQAEAALQGIDGDPFGRLSAYRTYAPSDSEGEMKWEAAFDPAKPEDVCKAMTTLAVYCGGDDTNCLCYSGSDYVPDQWNSLAAGCAGMGYHCRELEGGTERGAEWCDLVEAASSYVGLCRSGPDDVPFALAFTSPTDVTPESTVPAAPTSSSFPAATGQMPSSQAYPTAASCTTCSDSPPSTSSQVIYIMPTPSTSSPPPAPTSGTEKLDTDLLGCVVWLVAFVSLLWLG